jgi:NADH-quinone oxidoreductase subunit E
MSHPVPIASTHARHFGKVCEILDRHQRLATRLIPILQEVQEEYRYLPEEVLTYLATALRLPPARVFGVASFYAHFTLEPKGKHVLRLCDGTACHVKESLPILEALRARLKLPEGQQTTHDMLFTVETVSCLGACGLAPVVVVDDEVHGQMTPENAVALLDDLMVKEEVK